MLTIFSVPKPFRGHLDVIQRNAIRSWTLLRPTCQVILLGCEEGIAKIASEFRVYHLPSVKRNEFGTPLLDSVFAETERIAEFPLLCYVNADIILMSDFLGAVERVFSNLPRCLVVGRRWDLDVCELLDFSDDWERELKLRVKLNARLHGHSGIDYFVFPRGLFGAIPPFAVGRPVWDNWLIYRARSKKIPVVDVTREVTVVHQNHDYSHHPEGEEGVRKGEEARRNLLLAGGLTNAFTVRDATHLLTRRGIVRNLDLYYLYRLLVTVSKRFSLFGLLLSKVRKFHLFDARRS